MPKGRLLTDVKKEQIIALRHQCLSLGAIAKAINQSVGADVSFIKAPNRRKDQFNGGNAAKLSLIQE